MARTRILTLHVPRLVIGVIEGIAAGTGGAEIVGKAGAKTLPAAIAALRPDVVVIGGDAGPADAHVAAVRSADSALRIVSINHDGRSATVYEAQVEPREVLNVSPDMLLKMICGCR